MFRAKHSIGHIFDLQESLTPSSLLQSCVRLSSSAPVLLGKELPSQVKIVEVGPRDGLQNEKNSIPAEVKIELINRLTNSGLTCIEATSFVSPKWVPQLADAADVMKRIARKPGVLYPVLTPNLKGLENAMRAEAPAVAIFAAASEQFSMKNINCSVEESLKRFEDVTKAASASGIPVRGYVSTVIGCPYSGRVEPRAAAAVARALLDMGCYEVSMGDTIGVGTPSSTEALFNECLRLIPPDQLAAHMHDTYGQAIANITTALQMGVAVIDSSVAGLGGCPYAKGATGNVATEDVIYLLDGLGVQHGVDMDALLDCSDFICNALGKDNRSRVASALLRKRRDSASG